MIECEPTASAEVVKVVQPALFNVPVPSVVAPSMKISVPVGVPVAGASTLTVPVKVTDCPHTDGFTVAETAALMEPLLRVWVKTGEVLPVKKPSPLYTAVIECEPTTRLDVLNVANPEALKVLVPRVVAPSLKATVPVGVPVPGGTTMTVAVKVSDCPISEGFADDTTAVDVGFAAITDCVKGADVLARKLVSPL